jgi:hypothetical protein
LTSGRKQGSGRRPSTPIGRRRYDHSRLLVSCRAAWLTSAAGLFALAGIATRCAAPPAPVITARSVLLITIDTLRADHVGSYGNTTARTPTLDAIARQGVRFDRAWATAPITLP